MDSLGRSIVQIIRDIPCVCTLVQYKLLQSGARLHAMQYHNSSTAQKFVAWTATQKRSMNKNHYVDIFKLKGEYGYVQRHTC